MLISLREAWDSFPLKDRISYKEFDSIVKEFLKTCKDYIVDGHKILTPMGKFSVKERARSMHKPSVNIVASMRKKQELIDAGITPYESTKDDDGNVIGDNGGTKFYVYNTEDSFFYITTGNRRYIEIDGVSYKFTPAASTIRAVRAKIHSNELIKLRYAEN